MSWALAKRRPERFDAPPREEHRLSTGVRRIYGPPEWALFSEVRSATGCPDVLRVADAIAVNLWPSRGRWSAVGFECKETRPDWLAELRDPEKTGPFKLFCSAWYVVVPCPWKSVLLSLRELPERWGLIEIGTGRPRIVQLAEEREAEEPDLGFVRALLRAATRGSR